MSQVLALIIGASVLMVAALTVIVMVTDTVPGTTKNVEVSACQNSVSVQCDGNSETVDAPTSCTNTEGEVPSNIQNQVDGLDSAGNLDCSVY